MSKETKKPVVNGAPKAAAKAAAPAKPVAKTEAKVAAKTEVKPAAKGSFKASFKATAKPRPKSPELKIKVGQEVKIRGTRNGVITTGRFVGRTQVPGAAGDWLKINIAAKGKPAEFKLARAGQVSI